MKIALIIIGSIVLLIALFWLSRQYLIEAMSDEEIKTRLRKSRQTFNRLSAEQRDSRFGKNLIKSILFLEKMQKERLYSKYKIQPDINVGN